MVMMSVAKNRPCISLESIASGRDSISYEGKMPPVEVTWKSMLSRKRTPALLLRSGIVTKIDRVCASM